MRSRTWIAALASALSCAPVLAGVQLSAAVLDFGAQSMGTTSPALTVTITNSGPGPVTVTAVTINTAQFAPFHSCTSIAENASCPVQVTFTPATTAGDLESESIVDGTLTVATSAGSPTAALTGVAQKSLVTHFYRSILRRAPDVAGALHWKHEALRLQGLAANPNEVWYAMAAVFLRSAEYVGFGRNDTDFLTDLYRTFFNRDPDAGGIAFWQGQLSQGMPREVVVNSFMFSTEFRDFSQAIFGAAPARAEVDVVMDFYRGMLARLPDENGFAAWTDQLRRRQCITLLIETLMPDETEYIANVFATEHGQRGRTNAQYVGDLYNAILRRGGELEGVQSWVQQLDSSSVTRAQLRQAFLDSPEFAARVQALIDAGCLSHGTIAPVGPGEVPSVMVGDDGVPLVAYFHQGRIYVSRCVDAACGSFEAATIVADFGSSLGASRVNLARGADGLPVVFYQPNAAATHVARCGDNACASLTSVRALAPPFTESGFVTDFHGLGAGADGAPMVAQSRYNSSNGGWSLHASKCETTICASGASNVLVPNTNPPATNALPSIALGGDGLPMVAFGGSSAYALRTAHCNDAACGSSTLADVDGYLTLDVALAMGTDGLPSMAFGSYMDGRHVLRYSRCAVADCTSGVTTTTVIPYAGAHVVSQAVPADGRPFVAMTYAPDSVTKVVKCGNASCSAGNVVTTLGGPGIGGAARPGSVAVRADGRPVIAYMQFINGSPHVRLLSCANAACTPQ